MALADDIARDVASRYSGGDDERAEESDALKCSGDAIEAVKKGDRAAFLEAVRKMLSPDEYEASGEPGPGGFDPDTLE